MPVTVHGIIHQSLFRTMLKNPSVKKRLQIHNDYFDLCTVYGFIKN